ncbi:MAG: hypothetical protein ACXAEN_23335 [Candidatus Thorarchaeota archaeon]|jgi:hypothetical protein
MLVKAFVMMMGTFAPLVNAAYVSKIVVTSSQSLQADENGHTYLFVDKPTDFLWGPQQLVHDEDISYTKYSYGSTGWSTTSDSFDGPASRTTPIMATSGYSAGWLHNASILPAFYDFTNSTIEYSMSIEQDRVVFPLPIGEESSLVLDPGVTHVGVFNVTDQEFFHLTVGSRQDSTFVAISILDNKGRFYHYYELSGGDIMLLPFAPDGPGMYFVTLLSHTDNSGLEVVDLLLEAITPDELSFGEVVEGILPGSEQIVKTNPGDIVHEEKAPSAHTFSFSTNSTHPGMLRYAINHPELDNDVYEPFETLVHVTGGAWMFDSPIFRYMEHLSNNGDRYHYQSFQNETYYITLIGMEDTSYLLLNEMPDIPLLPLNQEFYIESTWNDMARHLFRLPLGQDSVIKLNSTEDGGFTWYLWRTFDDGVYRRVQITDSSTFHNAQPHYVPAGYYLLEARSDGDDYSGIYEFNIGPVLDGEGGVAVRNGGLVGVRVPTSALTFYHTNFTLMTQDNVTVKADFDILNQYGYKVRGWDATLANIQSGVGWAGNPTNFSWVPFGLPSSSYAMFCDGNGIAVISPYEVRNNTLGLSNYYNDYTVDYEVVFEDFTSDLFNATGMLAITGSGAWYNFTLGDPSDPIELYGLTVNVPRGTWLNISYSTLDVDSFNEVYVFMEDGGCTTRLELSDLAATMSGDVYAAQFRVGAISDEIIIMFHLNRENVGEGYINVYVEPYTTNNFLYPPAIPYIGPDFATGGPAPDLSGLALAAGGGGAAIVAVVVIVYFVRKRRGASL